MLCFINLLLFTHASLKFNSNITSTVLLRHNHRYMHCLSLHSKWIISWSNLLKSLYLLMVVLDSSVFNETIVFPVVSWDCSVTVGSSLDFSLASRLSSSIQNTPVPFIWSLYPSLNAAASNAVLNLGKGPYTQHLANKQLKTKSSKVAELVTVGFDGSGIMDQTFLSCTGTKCVYNKNITR